MNQLNNWLMKLRITSRFKRLGKILITITGIIILLVIILISILSPITKHLIEKYDEEFLGRQITIGRAYVNPLTGYIHLSNLKVFESDSLPDLTVSDSVFFSAKGLSVNIAMLKLLSKTYEISSLKLNQPKGKIIQNSTDINISDIVEKFSNKKTDTIPSNNRFSILNIKIVNGEFHYVEKVIPINYSIKEININSDGKHWNSDSIATNFSFLSKSSSGSINGNFTYNLNSKEYNLAILVNKFDVDLIDQYFKELSNYGALRATLDADFLSYGNLNHQETVTNKGLLVINDFYLEKTPNDVYASFNKLVLTVIEMNPKDLIYQYDSIILSQPYIKYERYDYLDNLQSMFGEDWAKITKVQSDTTRFNLILKIVDVIKTLRKNLPKSDFEFNKVVIDKGIFEYNDYTQGENFSIGANPLYIAADSIFKIRNRVKVFLKSGIHPYGSLSANLSINPKDKSDFDLNYHLKDIPASVFNPYSITHTSFPFDRGSIDLNGSWIVRNGNINSMNHLHILNPQLGNRIRIKESNWLPMPLILSLVSQNGNIIDYDIPITGNLNDPKFSLADLAFDVIINIFVKPTPGPYKAKVRRANIEDEKYLFLKWEMNQNSLFRKQERMVKNLAEKLKKSPNSSIEVHPILYAEKEKEFISYFEAKKKFFLQANGEKSEPLNPKDSLEISKVSIRDSVFTKYLNEQVNNPLMFTLLDKSNALVGFALVDSILERLNSERNEAFMMHFKQKGVDNRVKVFNIENTIPYNGFSVYKINWVDE